MLGGGDSPLVFPTGGGKPLAELADASGGREMAQDLAFIRESPFWYFLARRDLSQSRATLPDFLVEGGLVTDVQVRRLREQRMSGKTLAAAAAAAAAGMSERTARHVRIEAHRSCRTGR